MTTPTVSSVSSSRPTGIFAPRAAWSLILALFIAIYIGALFTPALLDDVDATHAEAAAHMSETGDWVTSYVNQIRYLEKPPLPYWLVAISYKVFGQNAFATHLPNLLGLLGAAWIVWLWGRRAWGERTALYAALGTLTAMGPFLFTRFYIPEATLSFLLMAALYCFLTGLESPVTRYHPTRYYLAWSALALATLTKGLIAPVFFFAAAVPLLAVSGLWRRWRELRPVTGILLYLAVAAPWHILAGLRNPDHGNPIGNVPTPGHVHGFFYFYFINEHVLRFLGQRYPHDYNKMPALVYWLGHLAWLFPWSLFIPAAVALLWRTRGQWTTHLGRGAGQTVNFYLDNATRPDVASYVGRLKFRSRTVWLLGFYSAFTLLFFSISTNQEYYTFPIWPALFLLIASVIAGIESPEITDKKREAAPLSTAWLTGAHVAFAAIGLVAASALALGLWQSRSLASNADLGDLLAHRAVGDYSLSMSHFFDLTGPSFAALRLPAILAALAFSVGPLVALGFRLGKKHAAATVTIALSAATFLIAAHIAFARFAPILSSRPFAETMMSRGSSQDQFIVFGDQSDASSVIFYSHRFFGHPAQLVHGTGSSMLWGSCYPDAPPIFLTEPQLAAEWGQGPQRHWLFAQGDWQPKVESLLKGRLYPVQTLADKQLWTDRPL